MMRALTLTQPWAGLVASGIKLVENRTRKPPAKLLGERFAIHASREFDDLAFIEVSRLAPDAIPTVTWEWPSVVLAVATLVTYVTDARQLDEYTSHDQHRWFFGPIGYVLRDVIALRTPVPCKGALGFWRLPENVEQAVQRQVTKELIDCSSIGAGLRDIKERGIDAHAADQAREMGRRGR